MFLCQESQNFSHVFRISARSERGKKQIRFHMHWLWVAIFLTMVTRTMTVAVTTHFSIIVLCEAAKKNHRIRTWEWSIRQETFKNGPLNENTKLVVQNFSNIKVFIFKLTISEELHFHRQIVSDQLVENLIKLNFNLPRKHSPSAHVHWICRFF